MRRTRRGQTLAPWARRRRRVYILLLAAVLLASPILVWRVKLRAELNRQIADLRRDGLPVTLEELAAWEPRDPREADANAAYQRVFESYREMDLALYDGLPKFHEPEARLLEVPFSAATRQALEARMAGNEECLSHLLAASHFPHYRLARQYPTGHLEELRTLERPLEILLARACLLAESGEGDQALDMILAGLRIGRACRATPFSQTLNQAIGYELKCLAVLPAVAVRAPLSDERLRALEQYLATDDWPAAVAHAATGDRCQQYHLSQASHDLEDRVEVLLGFRDNALSRMIDFYRHAPVLVTLPRAEFEAFMDFFRLYHLYSWWHSPASVRYSPIPIAVLRHYHDSGSLPEDLAQLIPRYLDAIPPTRQPDARFYYERRDSSFVFLEVPGGTGGAPASDTLTRWTYPLHAPVPPETH